MKGGDSRGVGEDGGGEVSMGIILFGEERCRDWLSQSLGTII